MSSCDVVSVRNVRRCFIDGICDIEGVKDAFYSWFRWIFYVVLVRSNFDTHEREFAVFRGLKRGDSRYSAVIVSKFRRLYRLGSDLEFFSYGIRSLVSGSCVFMTLTYSRDVSLVDAWLNVGVDFNRFMSRIRKRYGSVSIVRVFEAHSDGYPHVHVILVFHSKSFHGRFMNGKYRVVGNDFKILKSFWVHGFSDVQLVHSFHGGLSYLLKYLRKSVSFDSSVDSNVDMSLLMCWVFGKRSYGFSGDLFKALPDLIIVESSSNYSESVLFEVGKDLYGNSIFNRVSRWSLAGFLRHVGVFWKDFKLHGVDYSFLVSSDYVSVSDDVVYSRHGS